MHVADRGQIVPQTAYRVLFFDIRMKSVVLHAKVGPGDSFGVGDAIFNRVEKITFESIKRLDCQDDSCLSSVVSRLLVQSCRPFFFDFRRPCARELAEGLVKRTAEQFGS